MKTKFKDIVYKMVLTLIKQQVESSGSFDLDITEWYYSDKQKKFLKLVDRLTGDLTSKGYDVKLQSFTNIDLNIVELIVTKISRYSN